MERFDTGIRTALEERRAAQGDTYVSFARKLSVSYETYRRFAVGEGEMTLRTLQRVLAVYPELREQAEALLTPANASIQA